MERLPGIVSVGRAKRAAPDLLMIVFLCCMLVSPSLFAFAAILDEGSGADDGGLTARIAAGTAPVFKSNLTDPTAVKYNVSKTFTVIVYDADDDPLRMTWDWGDGKVNVTTTPPAGGLFGEVISFAHTYVPEIEQGRGWVNPYTYYEFFNLTIYLDDGNDNNVSHRTQIIVTMPINYLPVEPTIYLNGTNSTSIDPEATVYVVANSSDPEGESLTWTVFFRDDLDEVYRLVVLNTPATDDNENVWINISHSFGTAGTHRIGVFVSDALVPYQTYPHNSTNSSEYPVVVNNLPSMGDINVNPTGPVVNVTRGYVLVNYSIEAADRDGDAFTVTWDFDDGLPVVVNSSADGTMTTFRQVRNYTDAGSFNVTVLVWDGRPGHEVLRYRLVNVSSTNLPPALRVFRPLSLSGGTWAQPNETIQFEIVISEPERNEVEVTIDWGDGSEKSHFFLSEFVGFNVTIMVNHTYTARGNFTITLNYTDNKIGALNHSKTYQLTVETRQVYEVPPEVWSWWDYTTLALLGLVPVGVVIWMYRGSQHRRMLEGEGLTADEWKLLQDENIADIIEREKKR